MKLDPYGPVKYDIDGRTISADIGLVTPVTPELSIGGTPSTCDARTRPLGASERSDDSNGAADSIDLHQARPLALAIGSLLTEINRLKLAVWQRDRSVTPEDYAGIAGVGPSLGDWIIQLGAVTPQS